MRKEENKGRYYDVLLYERESFSRYEILRNEGGNSRKN